MPEMKEAVCAKYNVWSENDWKEKDRGEGEGVIGFLKTTAPKACQPQDIGNAKSERQKPEINRKDILKTNQDVARKQRKFPTDLRIEKRGTSSCCPGFPFTANGGEEWKNQRQTI